MRKPGNAKEKNFVPKGTTSGRYLQFISDTMDIMDGLPEMTSLFTRAQSH